MLASPLYVQLICSINKKRGSSMVVRVFIAVIGTVMLAAAVPQKRVMVDKVLAILYHPGGPTLILQSHLRPDLSDTVPTLQQAITKELVLQRAKQLKMPLSDADKERHLARAQEQLGMTREEITAFFKERGLTLEEAREELGKMLLIEMTIDHVVRSKAYVPHKEIEEYHAQNPIVFYEIKQLLVPYAGASRSLQRALLLRDIEESPKTLLENSSWSDPMSIKGTDIAEERAYIKTAVPGTILLGSETDEGFSLIQLVAKHEVPLAERKQEISGLLGKDRYQKALNEFYETLLKEAAPCIRYIDKEEAKERK